MRPGPAALPSGLGRLVARTVEATVLATAASSWLVELRDNRATGDTAVADIGSWDPSTWTAEASGFALGEGPRGALPPRVRPERAPGGAPRAPPRRPSVPRAPPSGPGCGPRGSGMLSRPSPP